MGAVLPERKKMKVGVEEVKVVELSMVTPSEETPRGGLWLSPLDLMLVNRGYTPTVYFYRSDSGAAVDHFFDVARLKAAMAKTLVAFYPLAGRLGVGVQGRAEIDCGGQGALFVVARSDLSVDDFSSFSPSPELRRLFVPRVEHDSPSVMCAVQVTFLKCGGVALGTALHHVAADAISSFHFFQTWSAISRDPAAELVHPFHDRTLLRVRSPPFVHPDALSAFCPKLNLSEPSGHIVSGTFDISKDQVTALKRACAADSGRVSTFCALSAHVWQCLCVARRLPPDATTRITFPASVRRSLSPPLPAGYFGNGIIWLGATGRVRDVASSEDLPSVAGRITGAVRRMDDELVRSAIDYFELTLAETYGQPSPAGCMPETELRVISWLGMPVYEADFGWGKPLAMLRAVSERAGFVYLMDGRQGDGGVCVHMCTEAAILSDFQRLLYAKF
jgi:shikimate O-hydroxycinnamoyltransferase